MGPAEFRRQSAVRWCQHAVRPCRSILAAAGLLCCGPFLAIPAAIVGWMELNAIKNGQSPPAGRWMAEVGLWVGIAASILHAGAWVLYILMVMLSAASNPYGY